MNLQNLKDVSREEAIAAFLAAFSNYFVPLPQDISYWKTRFLTARVDWRLSFGMFDGNRLVGFIFNGIGKHSGKLTAYNTGTGVLENWRGRKIVDQLYAAALPELQKEGIEKCLLEVICENKRAIKVYERIGFKIVRELKSFSGKLDISSKEQLEKSSLDELVNLNLSKPEHYSWDNSMASIRAAAVEPRVFLLRNPSEEIDGYFVIDDAGNLLQLESASKNYERLLNAVSQIHSEIKIKNVPAERIGLIKELQKRKFANPVNQYEMELLIEPVV